MVLRTLHRWWWRQRGEEALIVTFWPQDYPRNGLYRRDKTLYRITRYVRTADRRHFEVWGRRLSSTHSIRSRIRRVWRHAAWHRGLNNDASFKHISPLGWR